MIDDTPTIKSRYQYSVRVEGDTDRLTPEQLDEILSNVSYKLKASLPWELRYSTLNLIVERELIT